MSLNIQAVLLARAAFLTSFLLLGPGLLQAQKSCPPSAISALESGWRAYRADSLFKAIQQFERAGRLCPANLDAVVGHGLASLRAGSVKRSDSLFLAVLARSPGNSDAWEGHTRALLRLGDSAGAISAGRRAMALAPDNAELRLFLERIAPDWNRPPHRKPVRPAALQLAARTRGRGFEVASPKGWRPFYLQGVNLGVALPGRYPSEFPTDSARYAGWLDTLASMNANTLRLYTILPPSFYRALRGWNLTHPDRALWLVHGVWTELPPNDDFNDIGWKGEFQAEMRRVVDLVHGAATIPPRPGHAAGRYDADVSRWTLAYIIGREWEPFAVKAFDEGKRGGAYHGRFLRVRQGPAMDLWMAQLCDYMLAHEADTYNALRPIAYTNWPTLDPLTHPTEATTAEEEAWRRRAGGKPGRQKLEYENDVIALDPNLVEPTPGNPAGWFASYHAYPYYPEFMILDPGYGKARSSEGPSRYFGYLRELIQYHAGIPTVIAEYGVPSSRGTAHLHPQGWGHGGHDERSMAAIDARLTREIREAGAGGAILFAWLDEWFKKNWVVMDYEIPLENTRLWHNVMDAEQNYGIMGQYAGERSRTPRLGGDPARWRALPTVQSNGGADSAGQLRMIRAGADESYFYLAVDLKPGRFPWTLMGLQVAIDTYLPRVGQHRLTPGGLRSEIGFEFLVDLPGPDGGRVLATPDYNRYASRVDPITGDDFGQFNRRPAITRDRDDGRFDSLFVITNRARYGPDGTFYRAGGYDRGKLRYGTEDQSTLADWYIDERTGLLELRIPWDLLNVTDPSSRTLLFDRDSTGDFGTAPVEDFHIGVAMYQKRGKPRIVSALPALEGGVWRAKVFAPWRWAGWTEPRFHARLKPVYDSIKALWGAAPSRAPARPARRAPSN